MDASSNLWTKQEMPVLRQPRGVVGVVVEPQAAPENVIAHSKLSAEAKEFVPKGYFMSIPEHAVPTNKSVQSRLARAPIYAGGLEPQPDHLQPCNDYNENELEHLREVIVLLTSNPGKFDETIPALINSLNIYLTDCRMMECTVSCIVNQAVAEPNFGYSGARLCAILDTCSPHLRTCLFAYCDSMQFEAANSDQARNFTLFLAEIFSQLDWDESFGICLLKALDELLKFNKPNDIKCICQTLKLTGMSLEASNADVMTRIMGRLEERLPHLPPACAALLRSVLSLRAAQWGRSMRQQPTTVPISPTLNDYPPETPFAQRWSDGGPVFYGPDGHELSAEENAFLTDVADEPEDSDPDGLWDPDPEMDEEIKAAFKVFVAMNKKKS